MGSRTTRWILLAAGIAAAGLAWAGLPDASLSTVPNVLVSPDGTLEYMVTVVGESGPLDTALVQISFSTEAAGLVCWCTGQTKPLIEARTNASGQASFFIAGGGCLNPDSVASPPAVEVYANGILLKEVGVVSPDAVDSDGFLPTQGWNTGMLCTAGLSDAARHTSPISSGQYDFCTDMDSDLDCDLEDAVAITPVLATGAACTRSP